MAVALYLRESPRAPIARQRAALKVLAAERGWLDAVEYRDSVGSHVALVRLLRAARKGGVGTVAVWRLDRLAPTVPGILSLLDEWRRLSIPFVSVVEPLDSAVPLDLYRFVEILRKATKVGNAVRDGVAAARVRGACIGRKPLDCDPALVVATVARYGSIRKAAAVLGVSPSTIRDRLAQVEDPLASAAG